jgi:hypothetical protein
MLLQGPDVAQQGGSWFMSLPARLPVAPLHVKGGMHSLYVPTLLICIHLSYTYFAVAGAWVPFEVLAVAAAAAAAAALLVAVAAVAPVARFSTRPIESNAPSASLGRAPLCGLQQHSATSR